MTAKLEVFVTDEDTAEALEDHEGRITDLESTGGGGGGSSEHGILTGTRDLSSATVNQDFTGLSFAPSFASIRAWCSGTAMFSYADVGENGASLFAQTSGGVMHGGAAAVYLGSSVGSVESVGQLSFLSDGVRITWSKSGSQTGTANIEITCR